MIDPSSFPSLVVCEILLVAYSLISASQTVYLGALAYRRGFTARSVSFVWELSLVVVSMVGAAACVAGAYGYPPPPYELATEGFPLALSGLLAINLVSAILGIIAVVHERTWTRLIDVVAALILSPLGPLFGHGFASALVVAAALLMFSVVARLLKIHDEFGSVITKNAPAQTLELLPEGVLCIAHDGRVIFMNNSMRSYLAEMGLPGDVGDMRGVWEKMRALARKNAESSVSDEGIRLALPRKRSVYLTRDTMRIRREMCICILALDVTRQSRLLRINKRASDKLAKMGFELRASLANVQMTADAKARLLMRSRIHDIIGQRLSILHRYLESDDVSEATIAELEPLLTSILDDLRTDDETDPSSLLEATIAAFRACGLSYQMSGSLPSDPAVAGLFVRVIREASTNAIRHGQATQMQVSMSQSSTTAHLRVSNNGSVPETVEEHGGITGMRHAAAELGATLDISPAPRFTINVEAPCSQRERQHSEWRS